MVTDCKVVELGVLDRHGCRRCNLIPRAADRAEGLPEVAEVRR